MSKTLRKDRLPEFQDLSAKKAETRRQYLGSRMLEPGYGADLMSRADLALQDMHSLSDEVEFSPFLEIGAGSGIRSLVLERDFSAQGAATDISQNALQNTFFSSVLLKASRIPLLICCDAHTLPFLPETFRFVFAYRTLHHTPNPVPLVAECYRVLGAGGYFFCNEEPLDTPLRRILRGDRTLTSPTSIFQRLAYKLGAEKVFWDDGAWERSVGITEARFDRWLWLEALRPFEQVSVTVNRKLKIRSDLRQPKWKASLSGWIGGNVRLLAHKTSGKRATGNFLERLMCLDCGSVLPPPNQGSPLACSVCGRVYPSSNGILRVLPLDLEQAIYGDEPVITAAKEVA
jgi:SAM-dependent methyltransferase